MLNIGHIAKTYGVLPSHVIVNATTYDLMIADVMGAWEEYQYNKAMGKPTIPNYTQEELMNMLKIGKGENESNSS